MLTGIFSFSQYTEIINSNRPGSSHGAFAVGVNVLQFESAVSGQTLKHSTLNNSEIQSLNFNYLLVIRKKPIQSSIIHRIAFIFSTLRLSNFRSFVTNNTL